MSEFILAETHNRIFYYLTNQISIIIIDQSIIVIVIDSAQWIRSTVKLLRTIGTALY